MTGTTDGRQLAVEDDFGYEGRRRIRIPLLERLRGLPLVATGVFTAALILLILTTVHRPATWNDALPWDDEPSAAPVAAPANPDAPVAHTPAPRTPAARSSASASPSAAPSGTGSPPSPAASPAPPQQPPPPAPQRTVRHEAESASLSQARTASDHSGYSGSGFVDYDNASGSFLQWSVPGAAGTATLRLRFANASCCSRAMDISVNGSTVLRDVRFDAMRSWDDWNTVTVTVTLIAGTNTVRATATSREGGPNVDYLEVVQ
ncbi:carbohydrate-binding protein [Catellatospora methionotrophica]|uniref:carbohydrate-binding protein n=1 Tax=Catellatospora methionotrophica TaxID=121620 RepID=UPI00140A30AC|nr:carbohydrate-binding protein [Catellatospora methionotrophica]